MSTAYALAWLDHGGRRPAKEATMAMQFNAPPGWPEPPSGWVPDAEWIPDPDWPPAPADWCFWISTSTPDSALPQASAPEDHVTVDPRTYGTTEAGLLGVTNPAQAVTLSTRNALPWVVLTLVVLLAAVGSGLSGALLALGLAGLAIAVVSLVRGHVDWARVRSRRAGSLVGGAAVVALLAGGASATPAAPSTPSYVVTAPTTTSAYPATPTPTTPADTPTTTPSRSHARSTTTATAPGTAAPPAAARLAATPRATPRASRTPTPTTSTQTYARGVRPGAFCSPRGALGYTAKGTLMVCESTAADSRNRWRKA